MPKEPSVLPPPAQKAVYVRAMFTRIARWYDLMNSVLSLGLHHRWRRRAVAMSGVRPGGRALDVCTGTGDFAIALARVTGPGGRVAGIDLSEGMLEVGKEKLRRRRLAGLIDLHLGDAEALPYRDGAFDAATVGFGGRNVTHLDRLFSEMARVVRDGGRVVFLEISRPWLPGFRQLFDLYFQRLTPLIGGLVARDRKAYTYLPQSVA
ncbi:MAG TPA: ubiquinone/menaquinone biosynthesis methyltransferase, partial [Dehalococcoidia bacterium]